MVDLAIFRLPDLDTTRAQRFFEENLRQSVPWAKEVMVIPDFVVAYYAVTLGAPGVAVIAGIGSIAYGRNSKGLSARAGGWGWFGSDEGSAI